MESEGKLLPDIDVERCSGCADCAVACPLGCLEVRDGMAELRRPQACRSEGYCVSACSNRAIRLQWKTARKRRAAVAVR